MKPKSTVAKAVHMFLRGIVAWGAQESAPDCPACLALMTTLTPMQQPASAAGLLLKRLEETPQVGGVQ